MKKIITKRSIEALKQAVSLLAVVGDNSDLKDAGGYFVANSPFLPTRPLTLCINPEVNRFRCTATQRSGDAIDYVRHVYRKSFVAAVEYLAERFGFTLEYERSPQGFHVPQYELPLAS